MPPPIDPAGAEAPDVYYDIHAHRRYARPGVVSILNLAQQDQLEAPERGFFSAGLHPWFLEKDNLEKDVEALERLVSNPRLLAVGECGLDRLRGPSLDIQQDALERQIRLAVRFQKPAILHCVKAFPELLRAKKKLATAVPLVVHGFNNNRSILDALLEAGFYISLGAAILREGSNAAKALLLVPAGRLFLETDDSGLRIEDIYAKAAALLNIEITQLKSEIRRNFARLFEQADNI